jgi:hypothetical protein
MYEGEGMIAIIGVREIENTKPGTIKITGTDGKKYNCNKEAFIHGFAAGERYKIDYAESTFDGRNGPVTMKWINRARAWQQDDGPNTWPDKDPYQGGGSKSYGGGAKVKDNFDPEVSKTQTCINAAAAIYGNTHDTFDMDQFALEFPVIVEEMKKCFLPKPLVASVDSDGIKTVAGDDDIEF